MQTVPIFAKNFTSQLKIVNPYTLLDPNPAIMHVQNNFYSILTQKANIWMGFFGRNLCTKKAEEVTILFTLHNVLYYI